MSLIMSMNFLQYRYEFHLKDNEAENQFELDLACPRLEWNKEGALYSLSYGSVKN